MVTIPSIEEAIIFPMIGLSFNRSEAIFSP
jgi:hypothetical protein